MSLWELLGLGSAVLLSLSVLVGLGVGAILGQIGRDVSGLLESESWQRLPSAAADKSGRVTRIDSRRKLSAPAA